jgi:hypothetical protein
MKHSNKGIAYLLFEEKKEDKRILHGKNGKQRWFGELPDIRVDGLCEETRTVCEFNGCSQHGHTCVPFRDLPAACGCDTLVERLEETH